MPTPQNAVINPEADRRLGRIAITYGLIVFVLLVATTFLLSFANARQNPKTLMDLVHSPRLALLNLLSILIVLIPFYAGIHRLFTARLEIGRERVQARAWQEAVAALEPFAVPMQRFLDGSGEAHYLLAQAYTGLGDKKKAESARTFVRRKKSIWAEKLSPSKSPVKIGRSKPNNGTGGFPTPEQEEPAPPTERKATEAVLAGTL